MNLSTPQEQKATTTTTTAAATNANGQGEAYYEQIKEMSKQFELFPGFSLLQSPWTDEGFGGINWLWLIPLLSGLTSFAVSFLSTQYNKRSMPKKNA